MLQKSSQIKDMYVLIWIIYFESWRKYWPCKMVVLGEFSFEHIVLCMYGYIPKQKQKTEWRPFFKKKKIKGFIFSYKYDSLYFSFWHSLFMQVIEKIICGLNFLCNTNKHDYLDIKFIRKCVHVECHFNHQNHLL